MRALPLARAALRETRLWVRERNHLCGSKTTEDARIMTVRAVSDTQNHPPWTRSDHDQGAGRGGGKTPAAPAPQLVNCGVLEQGRGAAGVGETKREKATEEDMTWTPTQK